MTVGYSGKPLAQKLGLFALPRGASVAVVGAPAGLREALAPLPPDVALRGRLGRRHDLIHVFVRSRAELERRLPALEAALPADGVLWVSWPKRSSGVPTDMTEDVVRAVALPRGLVDVKVCAVDEVWSALKLVYRLAERPAKRRSAP